MIKISPFELQIITQRAIENPYTSPKIKEKAKEINKWVSTAWDEPYEEVLFIDELPF